MTRIQGELPRFAVEVAKDVLRYSPMLVVQGARQVGKSTLMRQALSPEHTEFVTLDDPTMRDYASIDPRGFVEQAPGKTLAIDEAQRVPELALALKASIDENRAPGRFAITGSADLLKVKGVSDSLAGRAESLIVYPLSQGEIDRRETPENWIEWILGGCEGDLLPGNGVDVRHRVIQGGYPEPLKRPTAQAKRWFRNYVERLATHDAKELVNRSSFPLHLENLLKIFASEGQQELVVAKKARQIHISEAAFRDYQELARMMYLSAELPSWGVGFSGRVVRRPKVSLIDSGLASALSGLDVKNSMQSGGFELFGATLEAFVVSELRKQLSWMQDPPQLFHYREREAEIDVVIEVPDGRLILIEIKSAMDVHPRAWKHLDEMSAKLGDRVAANVVLNMGNRVLKLKRPHGKGFVVPIRSLWDHP